MQCWRNIGSAFFKDVCDQLECKDGMHELRTVKGILS